jgi:hypothetical protein
MSSSKLTASAQPMSWPPPRHPRRRVHARQRPLMDMPIPRDELASEKAFGSSIGWGEGMGEGGAGCERHTSHHLRSSWVPRGGVLGKKGLSSKIDSIASKLVRYGCPSGKIRAAWISFPCNRCILFRVWVRRVTHSAMALTYLIRLASARRTVRPARSQISPMKVGLSEKGMSLEISQGMPRS